MSIKSYTNALPPFFIEYSSNAISLALVLILFSEGVNHSFTRRKELRKLFYFLNVT
jgi:hypothetical protein